MDWTPSEMLVLVKADMERDRKLKEEMDKSTASILKKCMQLTKPEKEHLIEKIRSSL